MKKSALPDPQEKPQVTAMEVLSAHYRKFNLANKSDEDCLEQLVSGGSLDGVESCKTCGSLDISRKYGNRVGRCNACREKYHVTAGTFFEKVGLPRQWLWAIRLREDGVSVNARQFSEITKIAYGTAWTMFRKLDIVIAGELEKYQLADNISSEFFCPAVNKRSLATPANEHPIAEQIKMQERERQADTSSKMDVAAPSSFPSKLSQAKLAGLTMLGEQAQKLFELLSTTALHFDDLLQQTGLEPGPVSSILTILELEGLIIPMVGGKYVASHANGSSNQPTQFSQSTQFSHSAQLSRSRQTNQNNQIGPATNELGPAYIDAINEFFKTGFHGISRKYLQLYLAAYWCQVDRNKWPPGSLLKACKNFGNVTREDIQAFESPLKVRVSPE